MRIVIIGAGNVATHISQALQQSGQQIIQIYSRTTSSASALAEILRVPYTIDTELIALDADVYLYSVSDDVLCDLIRLPIAPQAVHIHTAGSVSMEVFRGIKKKFGVLYPMQTFSKARNLDFKEIPLFIESSAGDVDTLLVELANAISDQVYHVNSIQRLNLHVSGVFACNFVNHLYHIASDIVRSANLPFEVLKPLITETASKVMQLSPEEAQTGPAKRNDKNVINKHIEVLSESVDLRNLYRDLSNMILNKQLHKS